MKTTLIAAILVLATASASADTLVGLGTQSAAPVGAITGVITGVMPTAAPISGIGASNPAAPIAGPGVIPASAPVSGLGDLDSRLDSLDQLASSGTAIALAMPVVTPRVDKPVGCGVGLGGYSGRYAVAASCARLWVSRSGTETTGRVGVGAAGGAVGINASATWLF